MTAFGKIAVWESWPGPEYDFGLTNNFLFFTLACLIIVCFQIPFGKDLCYVETSHFILKANWLAGFYGVQIFETGYNTVLFSKAAIA